EPLRREGPVLAHPPRLQLVRVGDAVRRRLRRRADDRRRDPAVGEPGSAAGARAGAVGRRYGATPASRARAGADGRGRMTPITLAVFLLGLALIVLVSGFVAAPLFRA